MVHTHQEADVGTVAESQLLSAWPGAEAASQKGSHPVPIKSSERQWLPDVITLKRVAGG